ncbi:hypothetical protein MKL09_18840 [Methylobacterium sp. J-048]|uniref:hypothetical protein n=1 Tax=Methylobacterium sp. J-048 TaxID=2836635 RepID=UPI001FBB94E7|nr:hypothetical protein [Methylobacterium sp. J-048]MCJ2058597.1 hypothetical protein [Methylobacterium sp. J-048]
MPSRTEHDAGVTPAQAADRRWLKLGIATLLGMAAGTMLLATEAQGRPAARRPRAGS